MIFGSSESVRNGLRIRCGAWRKAHAEVLVTGSVGSGNFKSGRMNATSSQRSKVPS